MKNNLRFTFLLIACTIAQLAGAQVTKLSNNTDLSGFVLNNNKPFLISNVDNSLWTTDGTPGGTVKFTTKVISDSTNDGGAGVFGGKIYFAGMDSVNGSELWVTDGTDAGTFLIKDIEPGAIGSTPKNFFTYNNQLFFFAGTVANGIELWKTDGTSGGTAMVKDINPGPDSSVTSQNSGLGYFSNNGVVYFAATDGTHGVELWKTDGTDAGTVMVKDINVGAGDGVTGSFVGFFNELIALGPITLFAANDGTSGSELWQTDGTTAGTVLVKDINPGVLPSSPGSFVAFNNKVYFTATTVAEGNELWVTDGTTAGTSLVKDINPGANSSTASLFTSIIFGTNLVFTATDSTSGAELWTTDGTTAGTALLKDINAGTVSSDPALMFNFNFDNLNFSISRTPPYNGKAFFIAHTEALGSELWITDGTAAGTVLVKDIYPGVEDGVEGFSQYLNTANGIFFSGQATDSTGFELWKSDGTAAGTGLIQDINPGQNSSNPIFNFVYNSHLFFTADDGDNPANISDLYVVDQTVTLPVSLYNFAATAQPSKAVKLEWKTTNELNSSHFDIERSADGLHFVDIDKLNAAGTTSVDQRYQYVDQQPVHLRKPVLFYRLKMVDKDGSFKYSRILAVHFKESSFEFTFSPNPVQNQLSVVVAPAGSKTVVLRVTDASGKQVYQQKLSSSQTVNQQNINVGGWQKGIYYLQLITDNSIKSAKFVKQ